MRVRVKWKGNPHPFSSLSSFVAFISLVVHLLLSVVSCWLSLFTLVVDSSIFSPLKIVPPRQFDWLNWIFGVTTWTRSECIFVVFRKISFRWFVMRFWGEFICVSMLYVACSTHVKKQVNIIIEIDGIDDVRILHITKVEVQCMKCLLNLFLRFLSPSVTKNGSWDPCFGVTQCLEKKKSCLIECNIHFDTLVDHYEQVKGTICVKLFILIQK